MRQFTMTGAGVVRRLGFRPLGVAIPGLIFAMTKVGSMI
jgi:hypothetical protein